MTKRCRISSSTSKREKSELEEEYNKRRNAIKGDKTTCKKTESRHHGMYLTNTKHFQIQAATKTKNQYLGRQRGLEKLKP